MNDTLTAVHGVRVGHVTDESGLTGCTVVLCPDGTVGGVDQRGGAPGTRETDLLAPMHLVEHVSAVCLAGGSAFGLAAADGVMRWCEQHGHGYETRGGIMVPIVPSAIVFDLAIGNPHSRPTAEMGYAACKAASGGPVALGSVGVGTGCRVGAARGNEFATKGGVGSAAVDLGGGLIVAALAAVNCQGDVIESDGSIIAGLRSFPDAPGYANMLEWMRQTHLTPPGAEATVIGVVATNAKLSKEHTNKVAQMAHDGLARAVRPAHTMYDGDTIFALATGEVDADPSLIGAFAAEALERSIRRGVKAAVGRGGVRAWNE
ncbi:MAG: P1 family peptidase [Chloroflexi bacterium]|nr:P1 family peptidase [Chloroflexota bacterium]